MTNPAPGQVDGITRQGRYVGGPESTIQFNPNRIHARNGIFDLEIRDIRIRFDSTNADQQDSDGDGFGDAPPPVGEQAFFCVWEQLDTLGLTFSEPSYSATTAKGIAWRLDLFP